MMDTKTLRELANAATPGPWRECGRDRAGGCCCGQVWSTAVDMPVAITDVGDEEIGPIARERIVANAKFVAAFSPDRTLRLLDVVEKAQWVADHPRTPGFTKALRASLQALKEET